jgi:transcriptional regulator with GAF, ATPase, and Fis domain
MQAALESAQGNISKAATLLGISRAQLDYRVKKSPLEGNKTFNRNRLGTR